MVAFGSGSFRNVPLPNHEFLRFRNGEACESRIEPTLPFCGYFSTYRSVLICNLLNQNSEGNKSILLYGLFFIILWIIYGMEKRKHEGEKRRSHKEGCKETEGSGEIR
jgi:hypothetical protein